MLSLYIFYYLLYNIKSNKSFIYLSNKNRKIIKYNMYLNAVTTLHNDPHAAFFKPLKQPPIYIREE